MAYDVESDRIILFGGTIVSGDRLVEFTDTWVYDLGTNAWEKMPSTQLPCSGGCPVAYDIQSDRVVMFHGFTFDQATWDWGSVSETWAYDYNTDTWTNMEPAETPFGLLGPNMVYDTESDRIILFGGLYPDSVETGFEFLNDTWAYDFDSNTWTKMEPEVRPPGRDYFAMTYDAGSDRAILFGGATEPGDDASSGSEYIVTGDTWSYDYNTDTWEELGPSEAPSPREYSAIVYDAGSDRVILFGGVNELNRMQFDDTWVYYSDTNTWTELHPDIFPSKRGWHAMGYSTKAERVILFGGGLSRELYTDETWIYDPETNTWTNVTPRP